MSGVSRAEFVEITDVGTVRESPARTRPAERDPFRVGAVQLAWSPDADEHRANLVHGVGLAAGHGAQLVCLQELTLSPYFAVSDRGPGPEWAQPEPLEGGPTLELATTLAVEHEVFVHASLFEPGCSMRHKRSRR